MPAQLPVIAILVTPESAASMVYGMYDLFCCAGRDWPMAAGGAPGAPLLEPLIVSARAGTVQVANGVPIEAQRSLAELPAPTAVCVPELLIAPHDPRFGGMRAAMGGALST